VDPRLLFLAEMLLAPIGIAAVLLSLLGIIQFVLPERRRDAASTDSRSA
jgi:hypothetical protein